MEHGEIFESMGFVFAGFTSYWFDVESCEFLGNDRFISGVIFLEGLVFDLLHTKFWHWFVGVECIGFLVEIIMDTV